MLYLYNFGGAEAVKSLKGKGGVFSTPVLTPFFTLSSSILRQSLWRISLGALGVSISWFLMHPSALLFFLLITFLSFVSVLLIRGSQSLSQTADWNESSVSQVDIGVDINRLGEAFSNMSLLIRVSVDKFSSSIISLTTCIYKHIIYSKINHFWLINIKIKTLHIKYRYSCNLLVTEFWQRLQWAIGDQEFPRCSTSLKEKGNTNRLNTRYYKVNTKYRYKLSTSVIL